MLRAGASRLAWRLRQQIFHRGVRREPDDRQNFHPCFLATRTVRKAERPSTRSETPSDTLTCNWLRPFYKRGPDASSFSSNSTRCTQSNVKISSQNMNEMKKKKSL